MTRLKLTAFAVLVSCGLHLHRVSAQDTVLGELYGQGVHAYFAGDYATAHEMFTNAIEKGNRDPRCYFFRGLTYARTGRPSEADSDFRQGAELEMASDDRFYPVSDSLQRIQGKLRMQIERHRQSARIASMGKTKRVEQARFEDLKRAEEQVLREPGRLPPTGKSVAVPARDAPDPFAEENAPPTKAPERKAPAVAPVAADDPFGASPAKPRGASPISPPPPASAPAGKAVNDDPFGSPPAAPKPAAPKPVANDPFEAAKPAGKANDDPFNP